MSLICNAITDLITLVDGWLLSYKNCLLLIEPMSFTFPLIVSPHEPLFVWSHVIYISCTLCCIICHVFVVPVLGLRVALGAWDFFKNPSCVRFSQLPALVA